MTTLLFANFTLYISVCQKPYDLVFIIDSSGSIEDAAEGNWNLILEFVVSTVELLEIGENDARVGLIKFSTSGHTEIYLDDYYDKAALIAAIRAIEYDGHRTNTAEGLELAINDVYVTSKGDRPSVPNAVIVILDGNSNEREDETAGMATALKNIAYVQAIGITDEVSMETLELIATDSDRIISVDDFPDLESQVMATVTDTCEADQSKILKNSSIFCILIFATCSYYGQQSIKLD